MNTFAIGDCRETMRGLDAGIFRCCVTSPPYWGLRDYGTARWEGGDPSCGHAPEAKPRASRPSSGLTGGKDTVDAGTVRRCARCGAVRVDGQLGLEATPDEYVAGMVDVFREVRRVLADDGTLWLNLGDSYASNAGGYDDSGSRGATSSKRIGAGTMAAVVHDRVRKPPTGLKPKDLVGIPWMVAFALRADGWYLRSDIIWSKSNPMPESVTDRPTKAHEYLFLLSKSERYFYDADAIREALAETTLADSRFGRRDDLPTVRNVGGRTDGLARSPGGQGHPLGRNRRTVWTIPTEPYPGSHFATFPTALVTPCILAGSALGDAVLDPFLGSGTVGMVAESLGRRWFGCELNPKYGELIRQRTAQTGLRFAR